jgi:alkanesulfonate monooxygenase SsuD/methylene tetrahydromethanopterin reductase-like flavin-dependent oxidoreductase (luciferase family)
MERLSSQKLTLGVFDHLDDYGVDISRQYEARLSLVEAYDQLGFHAYHVAEHHCTPHGMAPSPNMFLASVAQRTERLRFGPLLMLLNLYHPLRAFEEICMLDHLSKGRLEMGIGLGALSDELGYFGVDWTSARERYAEISEIIIKAMKGGTLVHHGRFFELDGVPLTMAPCQRPHPPMWLGVNRPESAEWAAANSANVACVGPASSVRKVTDAYRMYRGNGVADAASARPLLGMIRMVVVATSDASARVMAASAYERWLRSFKFLYERNGTPTPPFLPATFDAAIQSELCVAGTEASVRNALLSQAERAGVNYLLCQFAFGDLPVEASLYSAKAVKSLMTADDSYLVAAPS